MRDIFLTVLNMSLTASYVILLVMLIRLPLKKAPKVISYALWGVVAFRLICPFSFESILSLIPKDINTLPIAQDMVSSDSTQFHSGNQIVGIEVHENLPAPTVGERVNSLENYIQIGIYIWIAGMILLLIYSFVSVFILKRQLKSAQLLEKNIYEAHNLKTPFVLGFFSPKIYLPNGLSPNERHYILLHEQTHIKRYDYIMKHFAFLILSLHWFNPLVWVAFVLMSKDMELSCDESVLKVMDGDTKKSYATSLLSLAIDKSILNGSPLAFGEGDVKGRIKNVLNYKKPRFWVVLASVIIAVIVSIGLLANPKDITPDVVPDEITSDSVRYIQIEITELGTTVLSGKVITDKDGYKAGDIISVALNEELSYEVASLAVGDWIDVGYTEVREKYPPEFVGYKISNMTGSVYPTTFTLIENGEIIKEIIIQNPKVASELPALILSGSPESTLKMNGVLDSARYLIIDIGSSGDKVYYVLEQDGKYYVGNDDMHEISRETFDELNQYVDKNEIADDKNGVTEDQITDTTTLEPTTFESINNLTDVDMTIVEGSVSPTGLTVNFKNNSGNPYTFGDFFILEKKINDMWYQVPVTVEGDYGFHSIGYSLGAEDSRDFEVDWSWLYGSLEAGEYRIVKDILPDSSESTKNYYLAAIFIIE